MIDVSLQWELAQAAGMAAFAACLLLCALSVRARAPRGPAISHRRHRLVGYAALVAAAAHIGVVLYADPAVIEHLKPTAPGYEIAGIVSFIGMAILVLPAENSLRSLVWKDHRSFQATHVVITCLTILAIAMHMVGTDRYIHGRATRIALALLCTIAWLSLLRPRTFKPGSLPTRRWWGALVYGRHSRLIAITVLVGSVALGALSGSRSAIAMREPLIARDRPLPLHFPHEQHRSVNCVACHHDYVDRRGMNSCISCHRSHEDIQVGIEARFHDFCLGCHRDPPNPLKKSGPATGCAGCHHR
jgi:hypothetical protein